MPLFPQALGACLPGLLRWVSSLKSLSISHTPFLSDFLKSDRIHTAWTLPGGSADCGLSRFSQQPGRVALSLTCAPALGAQTPRALGFRDTPQLAAHPPDTLAVRLHFHGASLASLPPPSGLRPLSVSRSWSNGREWSPWTPGPSPQWARGPAAQPAHLEAAGARRQTRGQRPERTSQEPARVTASCVYFIFNLKRKTS